MRSFWEWFIGEAGAGWIIGILGLASAVYSWIQRERPAHVNVQEIRTIRLLDIHPTQRNNLEIRYTLSGGKEVLIHDLVQKYIVIYNLGTKDIAEPIELELGIGPIPKSNYGDYIDTSKPFLKAIFDEPIIARVLENPESGEFPHKLCISVPYLNSYPLHEHFISGYLISDREIDIRLNAGNGKGWSARFISSTPPRNLSSRLNWIFDRLAITLLMSSFLFMMIPLLRIYTGPVGRAVFRPSQENIRIAVQHYEAKLYSLSERNLLQRILSANSSSDLEYSYIFLALVLALTGIVIDRYKSKWIDPIYFRLYSRSLAPNKFGRSPGKDF